MRTYLAVALLVTIALVGSAQADSSAKDAAGQPSSATYTTIRAVVLDVERLQFPNARLELRILESSNKRVLDLDGKQPTVVAVNMLRGTKSQINWSDSRNIGALAAYYLLQGDEIRARMYSRAEADRPDRQPYPAPADCQWYICDIARVGLEQGAGVSVLQDDLELTLEVERQAYAAGEPVRLTFTVENVGVETKTLRFSSGQHYDFVVASGGQEVWRWSADKAFIQALTSLTLAPGEKKTFTETWRQADNEGQQVPAGEYEVTGVLTTMGKSRPSVGPVAVTITPKK